jgi:hypothetical protein
MEAKLKAKELVDKYLMEVQGADKYNYNLDSINLYIAKQCAIIAVENIINANPHSNPLNTIVHSTMQYWLDVKIEIQNL